MGVSVCERGNIMHVSVGGGGHSPRVVFLRTRHQNQQLLLYTRTVNVASSTYIHTVFPGL